MRNNACWLLLVLSLAIYSGCGNPATHTTPDATPDTCTGPNCKDDSQGDVKDDTIPGDVPDTVTPDNVDALPDADVDCNECTKDQVKCEGTNKYRECKEVDGCWKWSSKVNCDQATPDCVCASADDQICIPEDGEPCTCVPDCEGVECGPDGCGGTCGTGPNQGCAEGTFCVGGTCSTCTTSECAPGETICNGSQVVNCVDVGDGNGNSCYLFAETVPCPDLQTCKNDKCSCEFLDCNGTCCEDATFSCFQSTCCKPNCEAQGNECGSDGCGGSCGTCPADKPVCQNGSCISEETCTAKECQVGEQLCEGTAGYLTCKQISTNCLVWNEIAFACPNGQGCNPVTNQCECIPQCAGKNCGDDGCGGTCGACQNPWTCGTGGKCECNCSAYPVHPVCDLPNNKTYDNSCAALCAGADSATLVQGACPSCEDLCTTEEKEPFQFCGFDYVTYDSFCQLKCQIGSAQCTTMYTCPQVQYPGECQPDICDGCSLTDKESICGMDGATYINKCDLLMCGNGTAIHCQGDCVDTAECPTCTGECAPVCGVITSPSGNQIRKTFSNTCGMQCAGATLAEEGPCCLNCSSAAAWVCTAAFHAFKNDCLATCKAPEEIPILYAIPSGSDGQPQIAVCEECQCNLSEESYEPVCGEDYNSYFNSCALDCAGATVRCQGECSFENCPCPKSTGGLAIGTEVATPPNPADTLQRGVCGADGNTYGNTCSAAYHGTYVVQQTWCPSCATECAGLEYDPVCCGDNVTYPNLCIPQKCNSQLNPSECRKGRCCDTAAECDDGNAATVDSCNETDHVCENI